MITKENFIEKLKEIDTSKLSKDLQDSIALILKATFNGTNWNAMQAESFRAVAEFTFNHLHNVLRTSAEAVAKTKTSAKTESQAEQHVPKKLAPVQTGDAPDSNATKKERKPRVPNVNKAAAIVPEMANGLVERIPEAIRYIRRFINLDGKSKTKEEIRSFIASLQKAIVEKRIRKTSPYAKEIEYIQEKLVNQHKTMNRSMKIQIAPKVLENFRELVTRERIMPSIALIKRYISLHGKPGVKGRAQVLLNAMNRAFEKALITRQDSYFRIFNSMQKNLDRFLKTKGQKTLVIENAELNGLNGILNCNCLEPETTEVETSAKILHLPANNREGVMSTDEAKKREYQHVNLAPNWMSLLGKICLPTDIFIFGLGGGGKTSLALLFTQHLANLGYRILYVAGEQYDTPTFKELLIRLNINAGENFKIVDNLNRLNPMDFDFIALDTKDSLQIETEEFNEIKKRYPGRSFIVIPHATKSGNFKGKEQWRNMMDVLVFCKQGIARTGGGEKNRWGGAGEFRIFNQTRNAA